MFSFVNDAQHLKSQGCFIYFFDIESRQVLTIYFFVLNIS